NESAGNDRCVVLTQSRKGALEPSKHSFHATFGDHLHHLLGLLELVKQPIDFLYGNARSRGNPALARSLEHLRPRAFARSHRIDDAFESTNGAFVHLAALRNLSQ